MKLNLKSIVQNSSWVRSALVLALIALTSPLPPIRALENMVFDTWTIMANASSPPSDLLIVAVDEPSFQILGLPWPWPRRLHAQLVENLTRDGAKAVVFDIVFADPSTPEDDEAFMQAIQKAGNVILASTMDSAATVTFVRTTHITPLATFRQHALGTGLAMVLPDADGIVRRFQTHIDDQPTLPKVAHVRVSPPGAASAEHGLINFAGPAQTISQVSYYQAVDPDHPLPQHLVKDKIVFVGRSVSAALNPTQAADAFRVPFTFWNGRYMAGVEIQANILSTMLHGPQVREIHPGLLLTLCAIPLLLTCCIRTSVLSTRLALTGGVLCAVLGGSYVGFSEFGYWFPPIGISCGILTVCGWSIVTDYFEAMRQRAWIRSAFGKYISPTVVDMLIRQPELLTLGGQQVNATVLFIDLEGFTTLSESMQPADLVRVIADTFAPLSAIIKAEGGTVDKYIGDAIMAFWGAPVPLADHAQRACRAALAMQTTLAERRRLNPNLPPVHARIGIHSGPLIVGNIGTKDHFNYTCLGDTVNVASRLEAANKLYKTHILISETTASQLDAYIMRRVDRLQLKGRHGHTEVLELLGIDNNDKPQWLTLYEDGFDHYINGEFIIAADILSNVIRIRPDDGPTTTLHARCIGMKDNPPTAWHGVWSARHNAPA